jgi:hypothetical protein
VEGKCLKTHAQVVVVVWIFYWRDDVSRVEESTKDILGFAGQTNYGISGAIQANQSNKTSV